MHRSHPSAVGTVSRRSRMSRDRSVGRSGSSRRSRSTTSSTNSKSCVWPWSGKSRSPSPTMTGEIRRLSSSTRSRSSSHRSRTPLPWTCSSRPGCALSARIAASTSPSITWVFCQVGSFSVVEGTYLGRRLIMWPNGLSSWFGQYGSQISQVLRPRSRASARPNSAIRKGPISASACAAVQPPRSNPPRRSSSGPPGP